MYGKLFSSMYDGTISVNWQGLVTFQQFIILSDADGVVDMTPPALARRTGIPLDIIESGIEFLEQPDIYSRTADEDGRRIMRLDDHRPWGWFIVNHSKYKSLQDADHVRAENRKRKQKQRAKEAQNVTDGHGSSLHTDTDTDTDIIKTCANAEAFNAFWKSFPFKKSKIAAEKAFNKLSKANQHIATTSITKFFSNQKPDYYLYPATYLNNQRWNDEDKQSTSINDGAK